MRKSGGLFSRGLAEPSNGSRLTGRRWIQRQSGFTLVELLIVIAIIGVLALIAVPQLLAYKDRAFCAEVKSDLANLGSHQESYFVENHIYIAVTQAPDGTSNVPNFRWTAGVTLVSSLGGATSWKTVAGHPNCASSPITWDSSAGGLQ